MKQIISIVAVVLLILGCQEEKPAEKQPETAKPAEQKQQPAKVETKPAPQPVAEHSHDDGHGHGMPSGEPYTEIEPQFACEEPVVIEFFAYQCPHCYNLEPAAEAWRQKNAGKVKFVSVPTHLGRNEFGSLLLVHHAAVKLGVLEGVQKSLFERVHVEKKLFASPEEAADFLAEHGANKDQALKALNDQKAIGDAINRDFDMLAKYKVTSVPRVIVNHKYQTDITAAGGRDKVFELVDELLAKEHSCKPKAN